MKKICLSIIILLFQDLREVKSQAIYALDIIVFGSPVSSNEMNSTGYSINGNPWEYNFCGASPSVAVAIIDSLSCYPISNCNRNAGQANIFSDPDGDCAYDNVTVTTCRQRPEYYFIFPSNEASAMQAMSDLLDSVGNGNFIIAYSMFPSTYSTMDPSFISIFQQLGSTLIPSIADNLPFIFFCKKGDPGSVAETVGSAVNSMIALNLTYQCSPTEVNEVSNDGRLIIYPNPVSDELRIEMGNHRPQRLLFSIYDTFGRLMWEKETVNGTASVNARTLSAGFYHVKVSGENYTSSSKVCVVKE